MPVFSVEASFALNLFISLFTSIKTSGKHFPADAPRVLFLIALKILHFIKRLVVLLSL